MLIILDRFTNKNKNFSPFFFFRIFLFKEVFGSLLVHKYSPPNSWLMVDHLFSGKKKHKILFTASETEEAIWFRVEQTDIINTWLKM